VQVCKRIAVVEGDAGTREAVLLPMLRDAGFDPVGLPNALSFYRSLVSTRFDAALLDAALPDEDGFTVAEHLRTHAPDTALLLLVSNLRDGERQRGREVGVDAYVARPIERTALLDALGRLLPSPPAKVGPRWQLDERGWRVLAPDGQAIALSLPEQRIMQLLAATPGPPVPRTLLISRLVEDVDAFDPHRLEMLVYRLRRKCLEIAHADLPLRSVRGVGYVLTW